MERKYRVKTRPDNTVVIHQSKTYSREEVQELVNNIIHRLRSGLFISKEYYLDSCNRIQQDFNNWISKQ